MSSAIRCRKMMRTKMDLKRNISFARGDEIPNAADGANVDLRTALGKPFPQAVDVDFYRVGPDLTGKAENMIFNNLLRHDAILAAHEEFEHRQLAPGQDLRLLI